MEHACLPAPVPTLRGYVECNLAEMPALHNGVCAALVPRAVAYPRDAHDVASLVRYANSHNLSLSYRSGGHSYTCTSMRADSLHLHLGFLNTLDVDEEAKEARLGVGLVYSEVLEKVPPSKYSIAHGGCLSVGVGGFCLHGGGHPPVTRLTGLCNSTIKRMTVVTADGVVRELYKGSEHPELWTAMRIAGSSFGIATEVTVGFLDEPEPTQIGFAVYSQTPRAFAQFWQRVVRRVGRDGGDADVTIDGGAPLQTAVLSQPSTDRSQYVVMVSVRNNGPWLTRNYAAQLARAYAYLSSVGVPSVPMPLPAVRDLSFAYDSTDNRWVSTFNCLRLDEACELVDVMTDVLTHYREYSYSDTSRGCWMAWSTPTTEINSVCFEYNCPDLPVYHRELTLIEESVLERCPRSFKYYNVPSFSTRDPHLYFPGGIYDELLATKAQWDPHGRLNPLTGR